jgi:hypothetical protein
MFETVTEMKKNDGLGGFVRRHFGPVIDMDLACAGTREVALVLLAVTGVRIAFLLPKFGAAAILGGVFYAIPAVILCFKPSRIAASILVAQYLGTAVLAPGFGTWLWALFALRGAQLAFGFHRLRKHGSVQQAIEEFN